MAENVRVEVDLISGKLSLECPESSVDSILTQVAAFLPKLRQHSEAASGQAVQDDQRSGVERQSSRAQASPESVEAGSRKRASIAARPATPDARHEVQKLQLSVDEPGLLAWGSLGKDWKKYLWVLEAARKKHIDGLSNSEISYLMDKTFRESRTPKVVNNLKQKIKDRFVQPTTITADGKTYSVWRILADGSKEVVQVPGVPKA